ncbi:MAG: orotate phosphoribosyltransferase, partial [Thermoleophilaceae bacterium]|nr:orotate phosphoribosyltransferase [Thermoleophilaceae bacterium]
PRAAGWAALALVLSYGFGFLYSVGLGIDEEQTTLKDLGVDQGGLMLLAGAALIIVVAPLCEEFFFRGFLYRSFRTNLGVLPAALGAGVVFGAVHAPTGLEAVPLLIVLGVLLCLAYERSGTLYASIAVHAVNNSVAFAAGTGEWQIALLMGVLMLIACAALPWLFGRKGPMVLAVPARPEPPAPPVAPVGLPEMDARQRLIAALRQHALIIGEVTLASGATAQYYVDAKRATLRPDGFAAMAELVAAEAARVGATAVGGLTMGADPVASAALAGGAPVKAFFVRKETKAHGLQRKIEGPPLDATDRCLIVEDVVTSGGSTLEAIDAVKEAGLQIVGVVAVLDRLAGGGDAIREAIGGAPYVALATIDDLYPDRPDR